MWSFQSITRACRRPGRQGKASKPRERPGVQPRPAQSLHPPLISAQPQGRGSHSEKQQEGSVSVVTEAHFVHGRFYSARNRKKLVNQANSAETETNTTRRGTRSHLRQTRRLTVAREFLMLPQAAAAAQLHCGRKGEQCSALLLAVTLTFECRVLTYLSTG